MDSKIKVIKEIFANYTDYDMDSVTSKTSLIEDIGLNSIELIGIVSDIESEFDIEIPEESLSQLNVFGDIENYIKNYKE